jgi:CHAT domain-containing protein/Tfp pilus assembly protein PilF
VAATFLARVAVADPPDPKASASSVEASHPAPAPKKLSEADAKRVAELDKAIDTLWRAGKFAEGVAPARQVAAISEKALGTDHWQTADARRYVETLRVIAGLPEEGRRTVAAVPALYQEYAQAYGKARYADAERLARQIVEVRLRWLGEVHPDTAASYNNLALVLRNQGKLPEAEAMHRKALAIYLKALGEDHPDTAASYSNLAIVLHEQGKLPDAEAMHHKALAIRLKALGEDHPDTAGSYNNLANVLGDQGKLPEAEAMNRKALAIQLKTLGEDHRETALSYYNLANVLYGQGKLPEAEAMHRRALAIRIKALVEGHPDTAGSYNNLANVLHDQRKLPEAEAMCRRALAIQLKALGEDHRGTAGSYNNLAVVLHDQGKLTEAEAMDRKALAIRLKALGEDHPDTAQSYNNLAAVLLDQGKLPEAETMSRKALAIKLKVLGEAHPDTATSYSNLANVLKEQGKLPEAEVLHRRALAIRLKALGEAHPDTATSYNNLAIVLRAQGRLAEADAMHRKALAIRLKALGQDHPSTAQSYNGLAAVLRDQAKLPEAEAMHRKALAIRHKALGEDHPDTARSYNNLANVLHDQGKLPEAEAMHRKALAIKLKALGEDHPDTAASYSNLAIVLHDLGKLPEAEVMHRKALAIHLKALSEAHPDTARSYNNLASVLHDEGKLPEAEAMQRKALAIRLKALGDGHPDTAQSYSNLALVLDRLGKADEALGAWTSAVNADELARLQRTKGLESGLRSQENPDPQPGLSIALARAGRGREAWGRWERGLARAVLDETVGRAARPLNADERAREADLLGRSQTLDERISRLAGQQRLTEDDEKRLDGLRREASELRRELLDFQQVLEKNYGPLAGKPATLEEIQPALRDDTALVGWVDTGDHHMACVVRRTGEPAWVTVPGSGPDGAWTKADKALMGRLREALAAKDSGGDWKAPAEALAKQRLAPIEPHLNGVRRVVVVNSPWLAGVPVEVLFAARAKSSEQPPVIAYAPSASMMVHLIKTRPTADRTATLLALGDPAYPAPKPDADKAPAPPDHGLFVTKVVPNGIADLFGIKAGDVLLEYNGTALKSANDLRPVSADAGPKKVPLRRWRVGETRTVEVAAGPLGVEFDNRPAAPVVLAQRAADDVRQVRSESQSRLPGTRREVAAIAGLFPSDNATTLLGEQASESVVQGLARSGKLKDFRYIHFAAHGRNDPRSAYRTALILAPDPDRSADPAAFDTDGEISAEQIARTWDLDADLVGLSACETALGQQAGGEGFLGFAQPLLAKGARGLVLSLWRVDDKATSLLMARFYENLLGKRADLSKPMPKAEALAEAKQWLRRLTEAEVGPALEALERGEKRLLLTAKGSKPAESFAPSRPSGPRPFEHPYYWAAFILVGDPN